jgi:hypothetical protein
VPLFCCSRGLAVSAVWAPGVDAAPRKPFVGGGAPIPIERAPYQVFLRIGDNLGCGGSVLDATHVLTAAHCVVAAGQTAPRPPASITVLAGYTDMLASPPAGSQVSGVTDVRVHPLYDEPTKSDDVAVLTLAQTLNLTGARISAIALAPVGGGPAPGAALGFSGYGAQVEGVIPDGKLYGATLTAVGDDQCRPNRRAAGTRKVREGQEAPALHEDALQAVRRPARRGHELPRDGVAPAAGEGEDPRARDRRGGQPPPPGPHPPRPHPLSLG